MKNGFTLVELLAVIVIISLVTLISIISVTGIIGKSKEDLYNNQIALIEKAAKTWASENIDKLPEKDECIYLTLGSLKTYGLLNDTVLNPMDNTKFDDYMKIKISFTKEEYSEDDEPELIKEYDDYVMLYKVDSKNTEGCKYIYGDYTLIDGVSFNQRLKNFINQESDVDVDYKIKTIIFLNSGYIPLGIDLNSIEHSIDLSLNADG